MPTQLAPLVGPATPSLIRIQKAKVKNQQLTCEFTEQRTQEAPPRSFTLTSQEQVHPDLLHRIHRLVPHLCLLTEQLRETPDFWPDDAAEPLPAHFDPFTVTGLSLGNGGAGVTLIGQRRLTGGSILNLTSPYVPYEAETDDQYAYAGLLESAVLDALTEVELALRGKCAEYRQLDLFDQPTEPPQLTATSE